MSKEAQNLKPQVNFTPEQIEAIKIIVIGESGIKLGVLRLPDMRELLKLSNTTIWDLSRYDPDFPKPVKLTSQCTAWRADEVYKWLESRERVQFKGAARHA